jgi:hypothetical protein
MNFGPNVTLLSILAFSGLAALAGCAAAPATDGASTTSDLTAASVTPAHFACTAPKAVDLDIVTTRTSVKVTATPGDNSATGRIRADGHASLGGFLSEDHGSYSIKLDADMLRGEAGRAVLTDDEPGDSPSDDTYTCKLAGDDGAVKMCGQSALGSGHLQPGAEGGPDSKSVVKCKPGFTLCRIDPNGPDNDVCGDADDCFACSR